MKRKMPIGLIRIFEGLVGLLLTILINKYIDISDIYINIIMYISLISIYLFINYINK